MGDYGFKIAQPGYDVGTASNQHLILSSGFNTLKNYIVGNLAVTIPGSTGFGAIIKGTITHNLGFVPSLFIYPNDGTYATTFNQVPPDYNGTQHSSPRLIDNLEFDCDFGTSNVVVYLKTYDGGGTPKYWGTANNPAYTINYKYYIYTQKMA